MEHQSETKVQFFLRRQKELSTYDGKETRLRDILARDAMEGVKTELHRNDPMKEHDKVLMSKEEFFSKYTKKEN